MVSPTRTKQLLALSLLGLSLFAFFFDVPQAAAAVAANRVKIQVVDNHCTATPGTARGNLAGDGVWSAWATDQDVWDPDCVRVWIDSAIEQQQDIRFCIQTEDAGATGGALSNTACTPWASAGGSWSPWAADPDKWAYDAIRIKIDTQAMTGRYISNYRLGVQNTRATGDDCSVGTGSSAYTPMMGAGGGWSPWAPDGQSEGSIACTRLNLDNVAITGMPCSFNGTNNIPSGTTVYNAAAAPSVPYGSSCAYENRTCTNGVLSGSYAYSSCGVASPGSCTFNGSPVAHGNSVTAAAAPSVPYGSTCTYENRTCNNGTLSGSYAYSSCNPVAAANCTFNGSPVAHGASVSAAAAPSVPYGNSCAYETRTCNNGTLSGSYAYPNPPGCYVEAQTPAPTGVSASCAQGTGVVSTSWSPYSGATYYPRIANSTSCPGWAWDGGSTCYLNGYGGTSAGITLPVNASYSFWVHQYTPSGGMSNPTSVGVTCNPYAPVTSVTVSVNGGAYTSSPPILNPTDTIRVNWGATQSPTSCTKTSGSADFVVGGVAGPDTTVTAPSAGNSTTFGVNCVNAGGNHTNSVVVTTRAYNSCSRDGVFVAHGNSAVFYSQNPLSYGSVCGVGNPYATTLTCNDGNLGGAGYPYDCHVDSSQQPLVFTANGFATTTTVRKGSSVRLSWNGVNSSSCSINGIGGFVSTSSPIIPTNTNPVAISGSTWVQINTKSLLTFRCTLPSSKEITATINLIPELIEI